MVDFYLRFVVRLTDFDSYYKGPLFHKWLPDDENDAIVLDTNFDVKVWFERRGFISGSYLRYNVAKREIQDDLIPRQAVLDGGILFGSAKFNATEEQLKAMQEEELGSGDYKLLGTQIIEHVINPVSKFINLLRVDYGQYWIKPLLGWDSRNESLGNFFTSIELKWRLDTSLEWKRFQPTKNIDKLSGILYSDETFQKYITHEDWERLRDYVLDEDFNTYEINLAKKILGKAQQNWDESNYSEAFITVVSTLELAIGLFIKNRVPSDNNIYSNLENVFMRKKPKISLVEQVATVFTIKEDIELNIIEKALDGISLRNDIIHRGQERVTEENINEFLALSKCVQSLIFKPHFKYPIFTTSNSIDAPG